MPIEIGLTENQINTQYAPLAAMSAHYQTNHTLEPLDQICISMKKRDFSPADKLKQALVSIMAGCKTLSEANPRLKSEIHLATIWDWPRFADQSTISRTLDVLTLKQIEQLRQATTSIWRTVSQTQTHDWRGYLWLDFDLSGLPCSPRAEESQKGYFSGKKTSLDVNWHGSASSATEKRSGQMCFRATSIPPIACSQRSKPLKLL